MINGDEKGVELFRDACKSSNFARAHEKDSEMRTLFSDEVGPPTVEIAHSNPNRDQRRAFVTKTVIAQVNDCIRIEGGQSINRYPFMSQWSTILQTHSIHLESGSMNLEVKSFQGFTEDNRSEHGAPVLSKMYQALKAGLGFFFSTGDSEILSMESRLLQRGFYSTRACVEAFSLSTNDTTVHIINLDLKKDCLAKET